MTAPTDAELLARCLARETGAWEALVDRYADLVYGVGRRCGLDGPQAEDVVQETFLALLKNLQRLRRHDRLAGWIVKAARREAWRVARRHGSVRRREAAAGRPERDARPLPVETFAAEEERQAVREALASLEERCRRLLDALFLRGLSDYREVGRELGMPIGSIGPTRGRCLEKLVVALADRGFAPPPVSGAAPRASGGSGTRTSRRTSP